MHSFKTIPKLVATKKFFKRKHTIETKEQRCKLKLKINQTCPNQGNKSKSNKTAQTLEQVTETGNPTGKVESTPMEVINQNSKMKMKQ